MSNRLLILLIMLGVIAWGAFHAVGSYLGGLAPAGPGSLSPDVRRGLVVMGFTLAFLGIWALLLERQKRRPPNERP